MKSINFKFNLSQIPWQRPIYLKDNKLCEDRIINSLKSDFQDDIIYEFSTELIRKKLQNRFPRTEAVGVCIIVRTKEDIRLPMVVKNVIDALNGRVYTDDCNVTSIYAIKEFSHNEEIDVGIFLNTSFDGDESYDDLLNTAFLKFKVDTKPIDKVIAIPKQINQEIFIPDENKKQQQLIKNIIYQNYKISPMDDDVFIKCKINTASKESDLDNICINYLIAMTGTIFNNINQIKKLCINLTRNNIENCNVIIHPLDYLHDRVS